MDGAATTRQAGERFKAASVLLVALALSALAAFADFLLFFLLLWSCSGSDVSSPPPSGSAGDTLCTGLELGPRWSAFGFTVSATAWILFLLLSAASIAGPLAGGAIAARRKRWRPLAGGTVIGAGAVLVIAILILIVNGSADRGVFLIPAAVAFGLALLFFARSSRS